MDIVAVIALLLLLVFLLVVVMASLRVATTAGRPS
jgi:hypothetical protein